MDGSNLLEMVQMSVNTGDLMTAKIKNHLAKLARTAHSLIDLLDGGDIQPIHEMRLSSKLADMNRQLEDLVEQTKILLAAKG
jgi:hypothetical protein